jgi:hypothetical protein
MQLSSVATAERLPADAAVALLVGDRLARVPARRVRWTTGWWTHSQVNIGFLARWGFHAQRLPITDSVRRSTVKTYLWHRGLRILPGFWVVLIFRAVAVGRSRTVEHGSIAGYWTLDAGGPVTYVLRNVTTYMGQFGITTSSSTPRTARW